MVIIQQNKLTKESHEESLQTLTNICENVFKINIFDWNDNSHNNNTIISHNIITP
jgi:hypothetical protein